MGDQRPPGFLARRRRRRDIAAAIAAEHSLAPRPRGLAALAREVAALEAERMRSRAAVAAGGHPPARAPREAAARR
jgi:hypothetical protein